MQIVSQIRESQIAGSMIEQINFEDLQVKLLEILADLLSFKNDSSKEDEHIISGALGLWTSVLTIRHELVNQFFSWSREARSNNAENQANDVNASINSASDFIVNGIYSPKSKIVRTEFMESLELICERVTDNTGEQPLFSTIHILMNSLPGQN